MDWNKPQLSKSTCIHTLECMKIRKVNKTKGEKDWFGQQWIWMTGLSREGKNLCLHQTYEWQWDGEGTEEIG